LEREGWSLSLLIKLPSRRLVPLLRYKRVVCKEKHVEETEMVDEVVYLEI